MAPEFSLSGTTAANTASEYELHFFCVADLLRRAVFEFPPRKAVIEELLTTHLKEIGALDILARAVDMVRGEMPTQAGSLEAVRAVIVSSLDPEANLWSETCKLAARNRPLWGLPYLYAAQHEYQTGNFDAVVAYVERAERLVAIAYPLLLKTIDQLRMSELAPQDKKMWALALLAKHAPTVSNLLNWAEMAIRYGYWDQLREVWARTVLALGSDPARWPVADHYGDISAAGALCVAINKGVGRGLITAASHDYLYWNRIAVEYLKRALSGAEPNTKGRRFVLVRLVEAYVAELLYLPADHDQNELLQFREEAEKLVAELEGVNRFTAQRFVTSIAVGEARRCQNLRADAAILDKLVQRADLAYNELYERAYDKKKAEVARWHWEFLLEFSRLDLAEKLAQKSSNPKFIEAVIKHRRGELFEGIELLIQLLENERKAGLRFGYANILFHYVQEVKAQQSGMPASVETKAKEALRSVEGLLINASTRNLDQSADLDRAQHYLSACRFADKDPLDPKLLHLRARVVLARTARSNRDLDVREVIDELWAVFENRPELQRDGYLCHVFLQLLARSGSPAAFDPAKVWALVGESRPEVYNAYHALIWQMNLGRLDGWAERVLWAGKQFPDDPHILRLPAQLWERQEERAIPIIVELLCDTCWNERGMHADTKLVDAFPGTFFFAEGVLDQLGQALEGFDQPKNNLYGLLAVVRGLARGQAECWNNVDARLSRTHRAANWIKANVSPSIAALAWAEWFGSERGTLERGIAKELSVLVEQVENDLLNDHLANIGNWEERLRGFIGKLMAPQSDKSEYSVAALGPVVDFCVAASMEYDPSRPDSSYWRQLRSLVTVWLENTQPDRVITEAISTWTAVHQQIRNALTQQIVRVTLPAIHDFTHYLKDNINKVNPRTLAEELKSVLERTRAYLSAHRWPALKPVDLCEVLEEAAYSPPFVRTARRNEAHRLEIWPVRPENPVTVLGDRELLVEAVRCLLLNARRAAVRAFPHGWIWAEVQGGGGNALLEIRDNGDGASPLLIDELNHGRSLGYGTSLCHRIVQLHHGTLIFSSKGAGLGMSAKLALPLAS